MRADLHIGLHKTGTTSIQTFLHRNRSLLLERQGCLYPASIASPPPGDPNHHSVSDAHPHWAERLRRELQNTQPQRLILSSERLSYLYTPATVLRTLLIRLRDLGVQELRVLVYLRPLAEFLPSCWSHLLQIGLRADLWALPPSHPAIRARFALRPMLERWLQLVGREHLQVRLMVKEELRDGDLLRDALAALDLQWDDDFALPPRLNERLNALESGLLTSLNRLAPADHLQLCRLRRAVFARAALQLHTLRDPALRLRPPPQSWRLTGGIMRLMRNGCAVPSSPDVQSSLRLPGLVTCRRTVCCRA